MSIEGNDTGVGGEITFGILGRDTTLDSHATGLDVLLSETDFLECSATGNADLGLDDIYSCNFFSNCVFDLKKTKGMRGS